MSLTDGSKRFLDESWNGCRWYFAKFSLTEPRNSGYYLLNWTIADVCFNIKHLKIRLFSGIALMYHHLYVTFNDADMLRKATALNDKALAHTKRRVVGVISDNVFNLLYLFTGKWG